MALLYWKEFLPWDFHTQEGGREGGFNWKFAKILTKKYKNLKRGKIYFFSLEFLKEIKMLINELPCKHCTIEKSNKKVISGRYFNGGKRRFQTNNNSIFGLM